MSARLSIIASQGEAPASFFEFATETFEHLAKVVELELADTLFFESTRFRSLQLTIELGNTQAFVINTETSSPVLAAHKQIDVEPILQVELSAAGELLKAEAVSALANIVEHHGLNARQLNLRTKDLRRILHRKIPQIIEEIESEKHELHLHFKIADKLYATVEEFDRYVVELSDEIEELFRVDSLGELEGNVIGVHEIIIYFVGTDAKKMLERSRKSLCKYSQNEQDFLICIHGAEEQIFKIADLKY